MRTTLTLDNDVAARLESERRRKGTSLKKTVNDALRCGLGMQGKRPKPDPFRITGPYLGQVKPGIDLDKANQLFDELETEDFIRKAKRDGCL